MLSMDRKKNTSLDYILLYPFRVSFMTHMSFCLTDATVSQEKEETNSTQAMASKTLTHEGLLLFTHEGLLI